MFADFAISGASLDRHGFESLMAAVGAGTIKAIVTEDMSRISRDFADSAHIFKRQQDRDPRGGGPVRRAHLRGVVRVALARHDRHGLNKDSLPSPRVGTRHKHSGWGSSTIRAFLHNERYAGI